MTPIIRAQNPRFGASRRAVLGGIAIASAAPLLGQARLIDRGTPQLTMGPFYPLDRPPEVDADLTRIGGRERAKGPYLVIAGRVLDEAGNPVPNALLDLWQTNALGAYHHPSDLTGAPRDPGFQGQAILRSGADGSFRILTVRPAPYAERQRHIHFDVSGRKRRLITQMFLPEEANGRDRLYRSLATPAMREAVTAKIAETSGEDGPVYRFDIRLAGE